MERFESVYALGRALWEFASPLERDRWRSYYFDDRPAAAPANDSKFGMPLVEAWARGIAPTPQSGSGSRGARGGRTPGAPTPPAGDKTSLYPDFLRPDRTPPVDESVPELKTPRSTRARWLTASVVVSAALAAALAGARWWTTRGSVAEVSPQPVAPLSSAPVPTRPPPPRPEPPLDPRPADPVRVAGPPVHPPSTDSATKLTAPNRPKKPGHRNVGKKNADHAPDGLPILP
jgi:hypothetical protein